MGAGNYLPHEDVYRMVYVDNENIGEDGLIELYSTIERSLPESFYRLNFYKDGPNQSRVLFQNNLVQICVADNNWSQAVFAMQKEWEGEKETAYVGLAANHVEKVMRRVERALLQSGYELRRRNGPWMSSPVTERDIL